MSERPNGRPLKRPAECSPTPPPVRRVLSSSPEFRQPAAPARGQATGSAIGQPARPTHTVEPTRGRATGPARAQQPGPARAQQPGPARAQQPGPVRAQQPGPTRAQQPGPASTVGSSRGLHGEPTRGRANGPSHGPPAGPTHAVGSSRGHAAESPGGQTAQGQRGRGETRLPGGASLRSASERGRGGASTDSSTRCQRSASESPVGRGSGRGQNLPSPAHSYSTDQFTSYRQGVTPTRSDTSSVSDLSVSTPGAGSYSSGSSRTMVTRPTHIKDKRGNSGSARQIFTNYFELIKAPDFGIYQYAVDYAPEVLSRSIRSMMLKEHAEVLGPARIFDGKTLFMSRKLDTKITELFSVRRSDSEKIKITVTLVTVIPRSSPENLRIYNILFKRVLRMLKMELVGRHYYEPNLAVNIEQHRLSVWPGFDTAIVQTEGGASLKCDVSHKILHSETVLDAMYELYNSSRSFHDDAIKKFVGQIALTRYNNKTYRIEDISWDQNPRSVFGEGEKATTFNEYYDKKYQVKISDQDQPLLLSKTKKRRDGTQLTIALVPELCMLTGLDDEVRSNFHVMKDIAVHTRISPDQRRGTLQEFMTRINSNEEVVAELDKWNLKFSPQLQSINSRQLHPEKIVQSQGAFDYNPDSAEWSRETRGASLLSCVTISSWILICTRRDENLGNDFVQTLNRVAPPMGIRVQRPEVCTLPNDQTGGYLGAIQNNANATTQLVVCILPSNRKDRYDSIKKLCCVEHAIPSQVIVSRTLSKRQMLMSVCTKIAIQLNCKLGGAPWMVENPLKTLAVVGIDSYHDSVHRGKQVGAVVISTNPQLSKYYSRATFHSSAEEQMEMTASSIIEGLRQYSACNGAAPERLIIYQDGVSDGQLSIYHQVEIPKLVKAITTSLPQASKPLRVTFILVRKKISTRFFASGRGGNISNPGPGTIVDKDVTKPEFYDFFMVSQSVRQGTVTPCHYNVIYDTSGLRPDHLQKLTYKLCHLYYNWPGTIRVPAPCQYAHKLAYLVAQSLHAETNEGLYDKLYYL